MNKEIQILYIEDTPADVGMVKHELCKGGLSCQIKSVDNRADFLQQLDDNPPDVILSDHGLPSFDGFTALAIARERLPGVPFIFVTGSLGEQTAIETFEKGATDYVLKKNLSNLAPVVQRALKEVQERLRLKKSEAALRRSEALKTAILETALDAIISIDHRGLIQEWNSAAQTIFGYAREEAIGQTLDALIVPSPLRQAYDEGVTGYLLTGVASLLGRVVELMLRRADGTEFCAEISANRIPTEEPPRCTVMIRDVTERRRAEEALRHSEERFRLLIEGITDYAIYMLDAEGKIATWNDGAERLEGYKEEEVLGRHFSLFFPQEEVAQGTPAKALQRAVEKGQVVNEGWRVRKDGSRFWSEGTLTALRDDAGNLRGFSKIAHDVTRQKEAQEEIRHLNTALEQRVRDRTAQLQAANEELESFSYSVSHDLRAPLRHISGYIEILQSEAGARLNKASREHLQIITDSVTNMDALIEALLSFSRMGRAEMHTEPVSLTALAKEARRELSRETQGRDVEWKIAPLPEVQGDPVMLRQVFMNLISNALKYSRARKTARIEIGAKIGAHEIVCFVRDNGVGFDSEHADKIFGVFQRLHHAREFEGTGIGLASVRRIIHRHGGHTWAEGMVGRGATIYFSVPLR